MLRVVFSACLLATCLGMMGCGSDPVPTATAPQAEGQMAKTDQEKMDYLIEMLHRKNSVKKNAQAARALGQMGAFAEPAIAELKKAVEQTSDDKVRSDAQAAIQEIETALTTPE
ncbi:hypothetical protein Pla52o_56690 [Novipirellula galeiformis]|uniref:HEAT repeat protein n=1 Tax=Novipirellula galeiformis TaxID=2528004 RepID=A0A5C6BFH6_9BACT|nr:hypothetical protein [Novipirellula galeiformis]TWU10387.1 hypothetical protein Pla52o_56690 [Novipirellula galeiformis]